MYYVYMHQCEYGKYVCVTRILDVVRSEFVLPPLRGQSRSTRPATKVPIAPGAQLSPVRPDNGHTTLPFLSAKDLL